MTTITRRSRLSYAETLQVLKDAIVRSGNTLFASIDQAAAAESVGMTLRPTTLIVFGNPKGGTPLMDACPLLALDLPLKLLVWQDDGGVSVAYLPMSKIAARYGVSGMEARIAAIDKAIESLIQTIA